MWLFGCSFFWTFFFFLQFFYPSQKCQSHSNRTLYGCLLATTVPLDLVEVCFFSDFAAATKINFFLLLFFVCIAYCCWMHLNHVSGLKSYSWYGHTTSNLTYYLVSNAFNTFVLQHHHNRVELVYGRLFLYATYTHSTRSTNSSPYSVQIAFYKYHRVLLWFSTRSLVRACRICLAVFYLASWLCGNVIASSENHI